MAWSDAARAAALQARRLHAKAKSQFTKNSDAYARASTEPKDRAATAAEIRNVRRNGVKSYTPALMSRAVASTQRRNSAKAAKKTLTLMGALSNHPFGSSYAAPHGKFFRK